MGILQTNGGRTATGGGVGGQGKTTGILPGNGTATAGKEGTSQPPKKQSTAFEVKKKGAHERIGRQLQGTELY